ncbi:MAG: SAP domain-containing protein [Clostridia bacterium]|nr:SAP domain-containing protein [Clostridia bacterium]
MGLLSKIFGKNKNTVNLTIETTCTVNRDNSLPEYKGDYAQANFLNIYKKATPIKKEDQYQQYFKYHFGIVNPRDYHRKMISEGFLEEASVEDVLQSLKTDELKNILSMLNLTKTGKKDDLIKRILNSESDLSFIKKAEMQYSISKKGETYLKDNYDLIDLYAKRDTYFVTYEEYIEQKMKSPKMPYHDILWGIFNKRMHRDITTDCGCFQHYCMYHLLIDEKRFSLALEHYLMYFVLEINVAGEMRRYIDSYKTLSSLYSYKEYRERFPFHSFELHGQEKIYSLREYFNHEMIERCYNPGFYEIISKEEFNTIIANILNDSLDNESTENMINTRMEKIIEKEMKRIK